MPAVRVGLVGAGRWGRNDIRTIAALDGVQLVAVASRNAETATFVAPSCSIVEDWRALVNRPDVDGVIVASPPETHAEILISAIEHGKAVLVEKPVVVSRSDVGRIRAMLAERQAIILVDHTHLFHPAFRALCREAAALGPVRSIRSSAGSHGPYRRDVSVLWDWASHDLAMCLELVPGPARVERARRDEVRVVDGVTAERLVIDLTLAGDVPAQITVGTLNERHRWFAAGFDTGTLVFRDFVPEKLVWFALAADVADPGTPIATVSELPLTRAVTKFAESIKARDFDQSSIDHGLAVVDLLADAELMLRPSA